MSSQWEVIYIMATGVKDLNLRLWHRTVLWDWNILQKKEGSKREIWENQISISCPTKLHHLLVSPTVREWVKKFVPLKRLTIEPLWVNRPSEGCVNDSKKCVNERQNCSAHCLKLDSNFALLTISGTLSFWQETITLTSTWKVINEQGHLHCCVRPVSLSSHEKQLMPNTRINKILMSKVSILFHR